jgi:pSer/pThr/pTyr-binding forkhead associated (FHA) protein
MAAATRIEELPATSALDVPPRGDSDRRGSASGDLPRGRYLLDDAGVAFALQDAVTHIGRGIGNAVRLDDHTVSARHAIVVARPAGLRILDDRSTNGTIVNGRRVDEAELQDGDVVVLGRVVLTYRDLRAASPTRQTAFAV